MMLLNITRWFSKVTPFKVYRGHLIPRPPDRPINVFSMYYADLSKQFKSKNQKVTLIEARKMMSTVPKEQLDKYIENYNKTKEEYKQKMEHYNQQWIEKLKRTPNGFAEFVRTKKEDFKTQNTEKIGQKMKKIADEWKNLTAEQKNQFKVPKQITNKNTEDMKEYKIPQLQGKTEKQIEQNVAEVKDFCQRHKITIQQLYNLLKKNSRKSKEQKNAVANNKEKEAKKASTANHKDGLENTLKDFLNN